MGGLTDLNTQLPASSTFHARNMATSPGKAVSMRYDLPLKILVSRGRPFSTMASGVNRVGISPVSMNVSRYTDSLSANYSLTHSL